MLDLSSHKISVYIKVFYIDVTLAFPSRCPSILVGTSLGESKFMSTKKFGIHGKNFKNFDFTYCKIVGLKLEENVYSSSLFNTANKV